MVKYGRVRPRPMCQAVSKSNLWFQCKLENTKINLNRRQAHFLYLQITRNVNFLLRAILNIGLCHNIYISPTFFPISGPIVAVC